jgi:hypothetical protein
LRFGLVVLAAALFPGRARAHEGPPYAVVVDERAGPWVVSVWTDPDVGTGKFFVYLEPPKGEELAEVSSVRVCVAPTSGRLAESCHDAERKEGGRRLQYYAEVPFDAQEWWKVRVVVEGPRDKAEVNTEVEATPDGPGRWGLVLYLFPFVLLGGLWLYGVVRYRRRARASQGRKPLEAAPPAPPANPGA